MIREPVAQVQRTYESVAEQRNNTTASTTLTTTSTTRAASEATTSTKASTAGKIILNNLKKANTTKIRSIPTTILETETNQLSHQTCYTKRSSLSSPIQQQPKLYLIRVRRQQSSTAQTSRTERKVPQTHVTRVPFLPGSEPSTTPVKHTLPPAVSLVNHTTPVIPFRTEPNTSITANVYNYDYISSLDPNISPTNTSVLLSSMTATQDPTATSLPLAIQSMVQVSRPMSLTSMAGVQLTEADISQTDMSGAMPIATVEEINVPVFIDEYLQEIQSTSTTNQNGKGENGNGNEKICITNDEGAFDNFEFDIGMIAEDNIGQQMCQSNASGNTNNSNNNSFTNTTTNNNTNCNINNNNNNMNTMIYDFDLSAHSAAANNNHDNNNNNNIENLDSDNIVKTEIKFEDEFNNEEQFHVSFTALQDEESINMNNFSLEVDGLPLNAINFENDDNDLMDCFINSQQDPHLSDALAFPSNNSQLWFLNEEPQLPTDFDESDYYTYNNSQQLLGESLLQNVEDDKSFVNMQTNSQGYGSVVMVGVGGGNVSCENGCKSLKRTAAAMAPTTSATPTTTEVLLKRPKLQLNTKLREPIAVAPINTPDVLNIIADLTNNYELHSNSNHSSTEDITQNLIDSITEASVDAEGDANTSGSIIYEFYAPDTPQSNISHSSINTEYTSNTNFTGSFNTAPTSPAPSNCSTSQYRYSATTTNNGSPSSTSTSTEKKRRGRPSKTHSEIPSRAFLNSLPESERKLLLDRAKNNEASRISRRKNKEKEYAEKEEEELLEERNKALKMELSQNERISNKLKRGLKRLHFRKSDY